MAARRAYRSVALLSGPRLRKKNRPGGLSLSQRPAVGLLACLARPEHPSAVSHAPLQPGLTATYTVKGHSVLVTVDHDGVHHVTCPDLPQLLVSDGSLNGVLTLTEDEIGTILADRDKPEP